MTKQLKATVTPTAARSARSIRQEQATKRRQQRNLVIYGGAAFFVLLIALVVYLNIRSSRPVAGEEVFASQGNTHIDMGSPSPIAYNSTPPSSGPHYGNLAAWNIYPEPQRYELLNHNLEDGGVIVYYQCPDGCPETVDQLAAIVDPYIRAGRHVVMAPTTPPGPSVAASHSTRTWARRSPSSPGRASSSSTSLMRPKSAALSTATKASTTMLPA